MRKGFSIFVETQYSASAVTDIEYSNPDAARYVPAIRGNDADLIFGFDLQHFVQAALVAFLTRELRT